MPHALASSALLLLSLPHGRAFSLFGHAASEYGRPRAVSGLGNSRWAYAARDVRLCDTAGVSELESLLANVDVEADAHDEAGEVLEPPAPAPPPVDMLEGMTEGTWEITESGGVHSLRVAVAGKVIRFESGKMARLASGAVSVTSGQTNVFCAATLDRRNPPRPIDFTPLRVDYSERSSAAGRSPGGYIKRDGRPSDHETLVARLIDRPIRPLITTGWSLETQLATYVLAYDGRTVPDVLGICAASAALALSEVPFPKPVAGVRVAQVNGQLVVNPTAAEQAIATLDLVVAGTKDAVMMVEGAAAFVPEATVVEALELGLAAIGVLASAIGEWRAAGAGLPVYAPGFLPPSTQVYGFLERFQVDGAPLPSAYRQAMIGGTKEQRERNCVDLQARVVEMLLGGGKAGAAEQREMPAEALAGGDAGGGGTDEEDEDSGPTAAEGKGEAEVLGPASSFEEAEVRGALKKLACVTMRQIVEETGERTDGRSTDEVRPITIEMSPLPPSVHGSVLFTRGETQSLGTTTLGDNSMAQRYENLQGEQSKRFYLQYAFPPFSVGEVGRIGSPGRREVGHGNLAERALRAAVPSKEAFPYVIRTESLITESCGSSSMASVCAGCLSMLGAGVPLSSMVAGVAMGLLLDETGGGGEPIILTDILGSEDALGTMDFKVAGDEKGISAFQLDIKCEGLSIDLMRKALEQARVGRLHILEKMHEAFDMKALTLPPGVNRIKSFEVPAKSVGRIIGPGGVNINAIIAESGVANINIDKSDPAVVTVTSTSDTAIAAAIQMVEQMLADSVVAVVGPRPPPPPPISVGDTFEGCEVKNMVPFGVFVELRPGIDGFCHISELSEKYIKNIDDVVLAAGDSVDVKVVQINKNGQYRIAITSEFEVKSIAPTTRAKGRGAGQ